MADNTRKTIFLDIDGTIFKHNHQLSLMMWQSIVVLPGVHQKLDEWHEKDYYIIITTSRPEGIRSLTEKQLHDNNIFYDQLVMGLPRGMRVVINDRKSDGTKTTDSWSLARNKGLTEIRI